MFFPYIGNILMVNVTIYSSTMYPMGNGTAAIFSRCAAVANFFTPSPCSSEAAASRPAGLTNVPPGEFGCDSTRRLEKHCRLTG